MSSDVVNFKFRSGNNSFVKPMDSTISHNSNNSIHKQTASVGIASLEESKESKADINIETLFSDRDIYYANTN